MVCLRQQTAIADAAAVAGHSSRFENARSLVLVSVVWLLLGLLRVLPSWECQKRL